MGLLDYYRQFDDIGESEFNKTLRERRAREKALALEHVPTLDLSGTEWPELPNAEVVSASVYQARGRLNGYPDPEATQVRRALAERHNIRGAQIALGNGAAELLRSGDLPARRRRRGGRRAAADPVRSTGRSPRARARTSVEPGMTDEGPDIDALARSVSDRTRVLVLCNPNDPTGAYIPSERLGDLLARLPDHVHVLLDESYVQFQDVEPEDACMSLVEAFPRLIVLRSFSRIYGLSGIRAGYAVGAPSATALLAALAPALGVNALTQAAMLQALRVGDADIRQRRQAVIEERNRVLDALTALPVDRTAHPGELRVDERARTLRRGARRAPRGGASARRRRQGPGRRALRARGDPRPACRRPPAVGAGRGSDGRRARAGAGSMRAAHRRVAAAIAVLAAMVALAACGSDETSSGPQRLDLKIGDLVPRTGFLDQFGEPAQQAADLAVDEIRKAAAKAGAQHKVTITHVDYRSAPKEAVDYAEKFVEAGSSCLVGPWAGGHVDRVATKVAIPDKVLQISPAASGDALSKAEDRGYLNRVVPPDRLQAHALVELLDDKLRGGARGKKVNVGALEGVQSGQVHLHQGPDERVRGRLDREGRPGRPRGDVPGRRDDPSTTRSRASPPGTPTPGSSSTSPTPTRGSATTW